MEIVGTAYKNRIELNNEAGAREEEWLAFLPFTTVLFSSWVSEGAPGQCHTSNTLPRQYYTTQNDYNNWHVRVSFTPYVQFNDLKQAACRYSTRAEHLRPIPVDQGIWFNIDTQSCFDGESESEVNRGTIFSLSCFMWRDQTGHNGAKLSSCK